MLKITTKLRFNKKYFPLFLFVSGIVVFSSVAVNQLYLSKKSEKLEKTSQQQDLIDYREAENGEVAGVQEEQNNEVSPTSTQTTKRQTTPTNKPEVKSDNNGQSNNNSNTNSSNTTTVVVVTATPVPTNTPIPTATQAPVVEDNSWKIQWCKDSIAIYEGYKQEAMNQARINGQNECVKRGYSPPDYGSCSGLIDQWVSDAAAPYDAQILQFKLDSGCWMLVD